MNIKVTNSTTPPDCNGVPGGNASVDLCGVCAGGNTGKTPNADQDSCGVCNGDGTSCAPCSGTTNLTSSSGSFDDGSGNANYHNHADCKWLIQPPGATQITLNFSSFWTEDDYDFVYLYDGATVDSNNLIGAFDGPGGDLTIFYGSQASQVGFNAYSGSMLIHFVSDGNGTAAGFDAQYSSTTQPLPFCNSGPTVLNSCSGSFNDGGQNAYYADNSSCQWLIQPPATSSISLSFTSFKTVVNEDSVTVYDGTSTSDPILAQLTGDMGSVNNIHSTGGSMLVVFTSNSIVTEQGWDASYSCTQLPSDCHGDPRRYGIYRFLWRMCRRQHRGDPQ
ncbi:MAG: CUB domain-containing protein [Owenweeksia sp.]|nr:CUB domain-containing protein [Owenweeksia sp.]